MSLFSDPGGGPSGRPFSTIIGGKAKRGPNWSQGGWFTPDTAYLSGIKLLSTSYTIACGRNCRTMKPSQVLMIKFGVELYAAVCALATIAFLALALASGRKGIFDDLESMKELDRDSAFDSQIDSVTEDAGGHARSFHMSN